MGGSKSASGYGPGGSKSAVTQADSDEESDAIWTTRSRLRSSTGIKIPVIGNALSQSLSFPIPLDKGNVDSGNDIEISIATHDASGIFTTMPCTPTASCYVAYVVLLNVEICWGY